MKSVEQLLSMINDEFSIPLGLDECRKLYDRMKKIGTRRL